MHFLRSFLILLGMMVLSLLPLQAGGDSFEYSYMPKSLYPNQIFPITIIGVGQQTSQEVAFEFDRRSGYQPLFKKPLIVHNGNDSFYTFYFKAKRSDIFTPSIAILSPTQRIKLSSKKIKMKALKEEKLFCGVVAADMTIKNSQASHYDEKSYILTLAIEAHEANLEDMQLREFTQSGVDRLKRLNAKVEAEFYVVVPPTQKELNLTYFNTIKQEYISFNIPIEVLDASVVTQSELNPQKDDFQRLKKYLFIAIFLFFMLLFLIKRDFFYLVFATLSFITLLTFYIPHKKICLQEDTPLYILPTQTSTITTHFNQKVDTILLGKRKGFKKVENSEGVIGWIKNENICHN